MSFCSQHFLFAGLILAASAVFLPAAAVHASGRYRVGWAVGGSADGYGVILRTKDGGVTWTRQGKAGEIPDFDAEGVSAVDALNAWVVGDNVILRTRNGGLTWKQEQLPDHLPQDFALFQVKALDRWTAFAVGSQSVLLQTRSSAGSRCGYAWSRMRTAKNMPEIQFNDVDASDANHVWAVGGLQSGDNSRGGLGIAFFNGIRWKPQLITTGNVGEPCSAFIGVSAVNTRTVWAVGGVSCPPYVTGDGGKTWSPNGNPLAAILDTNRVVAVTKKLIWATTDAGIFRSEDGGASWESTGICAGFCYGISAAGTEYAWASDFGYTSPGDLYRWDADSGQWESQKVPADSSIVTISFAGARR
jgi:photosystem II stability/assembly factor-like uncharacterized protein